MENLLAQDFMVRDVSLECTRFGFDTIRMQLIQAGYREQPNRSEMTLYLNSLDGRVNDFYDAMRSGRLITITVQTKAVLPPPPPAAPPEPREEW